MQKTFIAAIISLTLVAILANYSPGQFISTQIISGETNSLQYATGGISVEERAKMVKMKNNYNTQLIFALITGHYLTQIQLTVQNDKGETLLQQKANGPLFYLNLPQGKYNLTAIYQDDSLTKTITAGSEHQTIMFHWKVH
jgi:hypothetical protein